jgi:5-methylcytosine-specific restriction endonuclease McrA
LHDAIVHKRLVLPDDPVLAKHAANAIAHTPTRLADRPAILAALHRRDLCGAPATDVDHIVPVTDGRSGSPTNLRASCSCCNR